MKNTGNSVKAMKSAMNRVVSGGYALLRIQKTDSFVPSNGRIEIPHLKPDLH